MIYMKYSILEFVFGSILSWFIPFPPPSFFSPIDGPQQRVGDALGTACSPLCSMAGVEQTPHGCISDCGHAARTCGLEAKGERLMCSTMLERLGPHLPLCTGIHRRHSSHGTRTQPMPASCLGFPSAVTGIILLWQGNFLKKNLVH